MPAQVPGSGGHVQTVDPVLGRRPRHQLQELLHVPALLVQEAVHELHAVLLALVAGKVGQGLQGFRNQGQISVCLLVGELVGQIEEVGAEDGGAEVAEEEAAGDQDVGDLGPAHLLQVLPDLVEAPLESHREDGVRVGDPPPHHRHHAPQVLPVALQNLIVVHFDRVNLQVQVLVQNIVEG